AHGWLAAGRAGRAQAHAAALHAIPANGPVWRRAPRRVRSRGQKSVRTPKRSAPLRSMTVLLRLCAQADPMSGLRIWRRSFSAARIVRVGVAAPQTRG